MREIEYIYIYTFQWYDNFVNLKKLWGLTNFKTSTCIFTCFKSCTLVPDNGSYGPKHVEFIDDIIKRFLCLKVIYMPIITGNVV